MSVDRPSWSDYFMDIADAVAKRSDCERDKVGAVIVKDRRIRATGYNGSPAGYPGCQSCPRRTIPKGSTQSYDNHVQTKSRTKRKFNRTIRNHTQPMHKNIHIVQQL
jgi:deoxycytidylate deaminase